MSAFRYRAISPTGELLQGQLEAASLEEAIGKLQDQGHTLLEAKPAEAGAGGPGLASWWRRGYSRDVRSA